MLGALCVGSGAGKSSHTILTAPTSGLFYLLGSPCLSSLLSPLRITKRKPHAAPSGAQPSPTPCSGRTLVLGLEYHLPLDCRVRETQTEKPKCPLCGWPVGPTEKHPLGPEGQESLTPGRVRPCRGFPAHSTMDGADKATCVRPGFTSQSQEHGFHVHEESHGGFESRGSPVSGAQGDHGDDLVKPGIWDNAKQTCH